jgi:hypothetical protein
MESSVKMQGNYKVSTSVFSKYATEIMVSNYGMLNEVVHIPSVARSEFFDILGEYVVGFWKVKQSPKC